MDSLALTAAGALPLGMSTVVTVSVARYLHADEAERAALRKAWRIRSTWRRTALRCGLYQADNAAKVGAEVPLSGELRRGREKVLLPRIRVSLAAGGIKVSVKTVGRVGVDAFEKAADDLANAWRVRYVMVTPGRPGWVTLRVTLRDGLKASTTMTVSPDAAVDPRIWALGHSREFEPVTVRTADVSGITIGGLSGKGKTSLMLGRFCQLAPSPAVQFALIDGKGYELEDLAARAYLHCGSSVTDAHAIVGDVHALMARRKDEIRRVLRRKNFWAGPILPAWPLVVLIMDEAHTFLFESKLKDPANQERDRLVRDLIWMCDDLVRMGRTLGIQSYFLTQKPTGEAIPTKIRDNCQIAMSFAQRSSEAARAALGDDILDYPHAHPRRLQDPAYTGVVSVLADGRPGYTLVRTPYTRDQDAATLAEATAHLVADPNDLLTKQINAARPLADHTA